MEMSGYELERLATLAGWLVVVAAVLYFAARSLGLI